VTLHVEEFSYEKVLFRSSFVAAFNFGHAHAQSAVPPVVAIGSAGPSGFSHPRQLLQQGKYDEAIAELQKVSATNSP
jgi:hypothetical protein